MANNRGMKAVQEPIQRDTVLDRAKTQQSSSRMVAISPSPVGRWLAQLAIVLAIVVGAWAIEAGLGSSVAQAQLRYYAPPVSYSNAQLADRDFSGQVLRGAEFANANLARANFTDAEVAGGSFSGSRMRDTVLRRADLTDALLDSVKFEGTDLRDAILVQAILLGSSFENVQIEGADFELALLDGAQVKQLCAIATGTNSRTGASTRESLGCQPE